MKQRCIVNKQGFVPIYALAILCIILSFVTLCVIKVQTSAMLMKQNKQHLLTLYCIHQTKEKLQEIPFGKEETLEESKTEEPKEEEDIKETKHYQGVDIYFIYTKEDVDITYSLGHITYKMHVLLNEQHEIHDIQYT